jgi:putative ABC transport system permease protein
MYVAVAERTFEIGLRKALGASEKDIFRQFLFEAIFITVIGGVLGILIGLGLSKVAEIISARYEFFLNFPLTWKAILLSLSFTVVIGLIFGLYPARAAAKLSPMEALRKE